MSRPAPSWPVVDGHKVASLPLSNEAPAGETPIRRNSLHTSALVTRPLDGVSTVLDILRYAARVHGTRHAVGWRDVIDIHEEQKEVTKTVGGKSHKEIKTWKYFQLSEYKYLNYVEVQEAAEEIGAGLLELGVSKEDVFNIYAQTR